MLISPSTHLLSCIHPQASPNSLHVLINNTAQWSLQYRISRTLFLASHFHHACLSNSGCLSRSANVVANAVLYCSMCLVLVGSYQYVTSLITHSSLAAHFSPTLSAFPIPPQALTLRDANRVRDACVPQQSTASLGDRPPLFPPYHYLDHRLLRTQTSIDGSTCGTNEG